MRKRLSLLVLSLLFSMEESIAADMYTLLCDTQKDVCRSKKADDNQCQNTVSYPKLTISINKSDKQASIDADGDGYGIDLDYAITIDSNKIESKPDMVTCRIGFDDKGCSGFVINRTTGKFQFFSWRNRNKVQIEISGTCEKVDNKF